MFLVYEVYMFLLSKQKKEINAAKICFFLAGFSIASWAPLVPYIQEKLNLSDFELSRIILLMALGSLIGIALTKHLISFLGVKRTLVISAISLTISTIFLSLIPSFILTAFLIFIFGFTLSLLEVASNIYGTFLEHKYNKNLLSTFHGFYSTGEIVALFLISFLLLINLNINLSISIPIFIILLVLFFFIKQIQNEKYCNKEEKGFVFPRGIVIYLALIASFTLMVEGSMLDWSAILMMEKTDINIEKASYGYTVVVIFLAFGRFIGANLIDKFGAYTIICTGLLLTSLSLFIIFSTHNIVLLFLAFALLGFSGANIMPIAVSIAGSQNKMSSVSAVYSVSTCAYGALLLGPVLIGYISKISSLDIAFLFLSLFSLFILVVAIFNLRLKKGY